MTRRSLLLAACVWAGVSSPAVAATSLWDGASGLFPDQAERPWTAFDTADPEDPALLGGILTLSTDQNAEIMGYTQTAPIVAPGDPWVIEFEMRFVSGVGIPARQPALIFATTAPSEGASFQIGADSILLLSGQSTVGPSAAVDTDDGSHVYRIEVFGDGSVDVYYDDALTLEGQTYVSAGDHGPTVRVGWGSASIASFGTGEWRSFGHDGAAEICGDGILEPTEECDDGNTTAGDGCDAACMTEVPEPAHALLLATGALVLLGAHRLRRSDRLIRSARREPLRAPPWPPLRASGR